MGCAIAITILITKSNFFTFAASLNDFHDYFIVLARIIRLIRIKEKRKNIEIFRNSVFLSKFFFRFARERKRVTPSSSLFFRFRFSCVDRIAFFERDCDRKNREKEKERERERRWRKMPRINTAFDISLSIRANV